MYFTEEELYNAAMQSLANMGIPDCFYCGFCGEKCITSIDLIEHVTQNHDGVCL